MSVPPCLQLSLAKSLVRASVTGLHVVGVILSFDFHSVKISSNSILEMSSDLGSRLSDAELRSLCETLWSWTFCIDCAADRACRTGSCPSQRIQRLSHFSRYYERQCTVYLDATASFPQRTLKKHADLWWIIERLRQQPSTTKDALLRVTWASSAEKTAVAEARDQSLAIDLAVRIATTVNCFSQPRGVSILEQGLNQVPWQGDVSFAEYIERLFPTALDESQKPASRDVPDEVRLKITASRLKKDLGLTFRPTDDLASHLRLDRESNVLEIYQHAAVLKEHLRLTRDAAPNLSVAESLKSYV